MAILFRNVRWVITDDSQIESYLKSDKKTHKIILDCDGFKEYFKGKLEGVCSIIHMKYTGL